MAKPIDVQQIIASNPNFYHAYVLAGDYEFKHGDKALAKTYYETALTKVIATKQEENKIRKQIVKCDKSTKSRA